MHHGLKQGFGFLYHKNGNLKYEGNFSQNLKHCKVRSSDDENSSLCKLYYESGSLKYEGGFWAGQKNGFGKFYRSDGEIFKEGLWYGNNLIKGKKYLNTKNGPKMIESNFFE